MDLGVGSEERPEEAEALQVIEMEVREQDVSPRDALVGHDDAQGAHPGAGIEDDGVTVLASHLDTGRVAAVADVLRPRRGERAATPPHPHLHDLASQNTVSTPCMSSAFPNRG